MLRVVIFIAAYWLLSALDASAEAKIYVYHEKGGVIRFSSKPPPAGVETEVFTGSGRLTKFNVRSPYRGKLHNNTFNSYIDSAAQYHGLNASLIKAVIHAESAFNPRAVSPKGARGLMQLMPETSQELGVRNPFDPKANIFGGSQYLASLIRRFSGNLRFALAAYNAGPGAVEEYQGIPPYRETVAYVQKVLELQRRYERHT